MKTGLFFGSFNPIHVGHLIIAQFMLDEAGLDEVRIVVSPHNPFKAEQDLWSKEKRLELAKLSVGHHQKITVTDVEFHLPVPSYTINTLKYFEDNEPDHSFSIIMGSDNLEQFTAWQDHQTILDKFPLLVYQRRGYESSDGANQNIRFFDAPYLDISATFIRNRLKEEKSVQYLVRDEILPFVS